MKISKRKNLLNYGAEGAPRKRSKWRAHMSRYIYFGILAAIAAILIQFVFHQTWYIEADGLVLLPTVTIRAEDDMRIGMLLVAEGEFVREGQKLFEHTFLEHSLRATGLFRSSSDRAGKQINRDRINKTDKEIGLRTVEVQHLKAELAQLTGELDKLRKLKSLEIVRKNKVEKQKALIDRIKQKIGELEDETGVLNDYRTRLQHRLASSSAVVQEAPRQPMAFSVTESFSPVNGEIVMLHVHESEVVLKGEPIAEIVSPGKQIIRAYFKQDTYKQLQNDRLVRIEFPGKVKGFGRIDKIYRATQPLPEEFQKNFEPVQRSLVADIIPEGEAELASRRHMMCVKVKLNRYILPQLPGL